MQWIIVSIGAALGAMLRLLFAQLLNAMHPTIPMGTLLANILGGFLMGLVLATSNQMSTEMRLLLATGFLGGLTTFSTFSAESFVLLNTGRYGSAIALIGVHVMGSILATALGVWLIHALRTV